MEKHKIEKRPDIEELPEMEELNVLMFAPDHAHPAPLELTPADPPPSRARSLLVGYIEDENPTGCSIPTAAGGVILFGVVLLAAFWDGVLAWWGE